MILLPNNDQTVFNHFLQVPIRKNQMLVESKCVFAFLPCIGADSYCVWCLVVVMMLTLQHLLSTSAKLQMICNIPVVAWRKILRIHWARVEKINVKKWDSKPWNSIGNLDGESYHRTMGKKKAIIFPFESSFWKTGPTFSWAMKKQTGCLGYVGDLLPSYIGIIKSHCKDPYWTTSIMESQRVLFVARSVFLINVGKSTRLWHKNCTKNEPIFGW